MSRQLVQAWGQFLSQFPWDWFISLTFREEVSTFRAHRLVRRFLQDVEKAAGLPIFWFRADEYGPRTGRFHIHALVGNVAHLRRLDWMDEWNRREGYARILPFKQERGAAYYCAKYCTKQSGDWDMSDNLAAFKQYQPVLPLSGTKKQPVCKTENDPAATSAPQSPKKPAVSAHQSRLLAGQEQVDWSPDAEISDVYRSEVTRGRGRFREFFIEQKTNGGKKDG